MSVAIFPEADATSTRDRTGDHLFLTHTVLVPRTPLPFYSYEYKSPYPYLERHGYRQGRGSRLLTASPRCVPLFNNENGQAWLQMTALHLAEAPGSGIPPHNSDPVACQGNSSR
eukprot:scaffold154436_cov40-Prasinocladus_malaysianus.AAC.2